jgi:undecaprenyl-diphosphatase
MAEHVKGIKKPVAGVKAVKKKSVKAVKKPVSAWRQKILDAGVVVAKPWRRYRASIFQFYLIVAVVAFLILAVLAKTAAYFTFDVTITQELQKFKPGWFGDVMYALSWIGFAPQVDVISLAGILFLFVSGLKWETVVTFVSVVGISILGPVIKLLVNRPRPDADLVNVIAQLSDPSFPSGHVLFFTTFYGLLFFLAYTLIKHTWWRTLLLVIFGGIVALIGVSRIYEGQHWASDVIASYLLGSVWLTLTVYLYSWGKTRFFVNQPLAPAAGAASVAAPKVKSSS